jgi:hypothetical protein
MPVTFDDLIPKQSDAPIAVDFSDLIPKPQPSDQAGKDYLARVTATSAPPMTPEEMARTGMTHWGSGDSAPPEGTENNPFTGKAASDKPLLSTEAIKRALSAMGEIGAPEPPQPDPISDKINKAIAERLSGLTTEKFVSTTPKYLVPGYAEAQGLEGLSESLPALKEGIKRGDTGAITGGTLDAAMSALMLSHRLIPKAGVPSTLDETGAPPEPQIVEPPRAETPKPLETPQIAGQEPGEIVYGYPDVPEEPSPAAGITAPAETAAPAPSVPESLAAGAVPTPEPAGLAEAMAELKRRNMVTPGEVFKGEEPVAEVAPVNVPEDTAQAAAAKFMRAPRADGGLLPEGADASTLWARLQRVSDASKSRANQERAQALQVKEAERQYRSFSSAIRKPAPGERPISASELNVGDTVTIKDAPFKVTGIDPDDFSVTIEDGSRFGIQNIGEKDVIYGEVEPKELKFAAPESVEEQQARTEQEAAVKENRAAQQAKSDEVQYGWQQKLTGYTGDMGQGDLLGGGDLFAPKLKLKPKGEAGSVGLPGSKSDRPYGSPIGATYGSGRYRRTYQVNKEAGDAMNALASSNESARLRAEIANRNISAGLNKTERANVGRFLVSERLKTVNPAHPQILSYAETHAILSNPKVRQAVAKYVAEVKPEVEALRKKAGLSESAAAGKAPEFISLIPDGDKMLPEPQGQLPINTPMRMQSKTTRFAKHAEGMAEKYKTDLRDVLSASYTEVMKKARLRDLYATLVKNDLYSTRPVDEIKLQKTEAVPFGRARKGATGPALPEVAWIPRAIANDLRDVMEKPPESSGPIIKAGKSIQRGITGAALTANPAEIINHMRRQLNLVASVPPAHAGITARLAEAMVPYIGPKFGTFARVVTDSMSKPENQAILRDIFDAGGGSGRGFKTYESKIPILRQIQAGTNKLLFGVPKGRGVGGWDLRMRVQLEKIRRVVEGNVDPQRIREFANQIGQYTDKPDWIIEAIRNVNPYAATTLPMRLTELRRAFGGSGLKFKGAASALEGRVETFLRGTGGTLLGLAAGNYLLSGKWPWQNDRGHEFDLNTGMNDKDGRRVYVKLRSIAPELSRPVSTFSEPELARESSVKKPEYVSAGMVGPANQLLSILGGGPAGNAALAAMTGYAPYFTKIPGKAPSLLDIAKVNKEEQKHLPAAMRDRGVRQIVTALESVNPVGAALEAPKSYEVQRAPLRQIEQPIPGIRPFGSVFTKSYEKKAR